MDKTTILSKTEVTPAGLARSKFIDRAQSATRDDQFEEKVIQVNRVSKKTKGGNRISFSVLVVVGDKKGSVGIGLGKAPDVLSAIRKASRRGKNKLLRIPLKNTTIPFAMKLKQGASQVLLKPAPPGTGIIAGGPVRAVVEVAGIRDIVAKILGTRNKLSNVYTTYAALERIAHIYRLKQKKVKNN